MLYSCTAAVVTLYSCAVLFVYIINCLISFILLLSLKLSFHRFFDFSDDGASIGRQRSSEGHHVTFCDSLVESSHEENDSSVIINDSLANRNNSSALKETIDNVRQCDSQPVSPVGDVTPKAPILRIHRTPR